MPELFGHTRARIAPRHALITPDNHVSSVVPGVTKAKAVILVNEAMGAGFAQLLVAFESGGSASGQGRGGLQTFGYLMAGAAAVAVEGRSRRLGEGGYFYAPPGAKWKVSAAKAGTQITLFQKRYVPLGDTPVPRPLLGDASRVKGQPFLGDPAANLQVLLPDEPAFDFAVNVFAYRPGGHLPYVEVHVMEHGLIMLDGEGVYRLEDSWYPVRSGDAIWMAPYCPQWFVAMGKVPARYLYYKDVNRAAI